MTPPRQPLLVAILGPTASGKTHLAERLAVSLDAQLISADAFQVYRGFDIGTAKPKNRKHYKLIDILAPTEAFGVGEFVQLALRELQELWDSKRNAVVVGGTGLYVRALVEQYRELSPNPDPALRRSLAAQEAREGLAALVEKLRALDPASAAKTDMKNPARVRRALEKVLSPNPPLRVEIPPFRIRKLALSPNPGTLREKIHARTLEMMQNGWVREVKGLKEWGLSPEVPAMRAIGYWAIWQLLDGALSEREAFERIVNETAQYAKRQRTWLRSEPRTLIVEGFGQDEGVIEAASAYCLKLQGSKNG